MDNIVFISSSLGTAFVLGYAVGFQLLAFKKAVEVST